MTSSVTTAWGVDWDETLIARDLMQNFFDANRERLEEVVVQHDASTVAVTAPTRCVLERLFFLGSEKGEQDIGQYGEGFKAATTCLLRDHRTTPIVASGNRVVCLRVATEAVADSRLMFPVEYDFYRTKSEIPGTVLVLDGASRDLIAAMRVGLQHFLHDQNPLLGALRWEHHSGNFSLYDSTDKDGHIFYRRLKRGQIEGVPVILVINREYAEIERKTRQDRDRKAFGEELMQKFYDVFSKHGSSSARIAQHVIVEAARPFWEKGHPLLRAVASGAHYYAAWPAELVAEVFGNRYYARSQRSHDQAQQLQFETIERSWQSQGWLGLPSYFRQFGVPSADEEVKKAKDEADREARQQGSRGPTVAEQECLRLLNQVLHDLNPATAQVFERGTTKYTVAKTDVLLGQLRTARSYHSHEVFFAESVFVGDFSHALAVHLHEHSHIFGYDGSRGFTDALTELIEAAVAHRGDFDDYEARWNRTRDAVRSEREQQGIASPEDAVAARLAKLSKAQLRELVGRVPQGILKKLFDDH
ncbi:MAG TPA: hypothetical protein VFE46_01645 [Pirellulales bacterium]|nr:hypothetical protein [Pirellulales bacterium]